MAMIGEGLEGLKTKNVKSVESLSQTLKNKIAENEKARVEDTIQRILGYKQEVEELKEAARQSLLEIADDLDGVTKDANVVKASGSGVGTVGGVLSLTGMALSATGVGAAAGVPLMTAG